MAKPQPQRLPMKTLETTGLCASCGFLGLWSNEGELWEADENYRLSGQTTSGKISQRRLPICAALRLDFRHEMQEHMRSASTIKPSDDFNDRTIHPIPEDSLAVVADDTRDCNRTEKQPYGWFQWQPGFSPMEHRRMLDREFMLKREDDRDKEMRDREDARDNFNLKFRIGEIVFLSLVAIVAALVGRSW
jgi:hypothetical protein